jgi:AraC-like DNA-binding protein
MIGLVRVSPPSGRSAGVVRLERLPNTKTAHLAGYLVLCRCSEELDTTLTWHGEVRVARPSVALGLVCQPEILFGALGKLTAPVNPVIAPEALQAGRIPDSGLTAIRTASVEAKVLEDLWHAKGARILQEQPLLETLISHASHGKKLQSVSRSLGLSEDTIRRRLRAIGLQPGALIREIRINAYTLLLRMGDSPSRALVACGWNDPKARQKVVARFRQQHQ